MRSSDDFEKVEDAIGYGQVEELLIRAHRQLELIPVMLENKPWDVDPETHQVSLSFQ